MIRTPENDAEAHALFWNAEVDGSIHMPGQPLFDHPSMGIGWIKDLEIVGITRVDNRYTDFDNLEDHAKPTIFARTSEDFSGNTIHGDFKFVNPELFQLDDEAELYEIASLVSAIKLANERKGGDYVLFLHADFALTMCCEIVASK